LALTPRMGGTGKHRVLGRYPPLALAAQERRHLLLDARRDQYARVAESDQHRSFGVLGETGEYLDGAHFVGRAAGWSHGGFQSGDSFSDFALATRYAAVMTSPPVSELTERARAIFRLVVEGYLDSGHPVGSKTLAEGGINLSPASIRSVLSELEALGLLAAPHTSAGRMPTDLGLRLFVDGMMQVAEPTAEERAAIERRLDRPGPIEAALEATSSVLSELSGAAGMVMVPRREPALAQMSIVPLDRGRALAVVVGADGTIENRILELPPGTSVSMLQEASNYITARLAGRTLAEAARAMQAEIASGKSALD